MKKSIVNSILLIILVALTIAGCAKPQPTETLVEPSQEQPPEMTISEPQDNSAVEEVIEKQPAKPIILERVLFDFDQATLSDQARGTLSANAAVLRTAPEVRVSIEGHCDERGSDEYNLALGERRAQSVRTYLVSLGVAPERLETISYGEEMPTDAMNNEMAWAKNRRAEFKLLN